MKAYFINKVLATTVVGSYPVVKGTGIKAFLILSDLQLKLQSPTRFQQALTLFQMDRYEETWSACFRANFPGSKTRT